MATLLRKGVIKKIQWVYGEDDVVGMHWGFLDVYHYEIHDLDAVVALLGPYQRLIQTESGYGRAKLEAHWSDDKGREFTASVPAGVLIKQGFDYEVQFSNAVTFKDRLYGIFRFRPDQNSSWNVEDWLAWLEDTECNFPARFTDLGNCLPEDLKQQIGDSLPKVRRPERVLRNHRDRLETALRIFQRISGELSGRRNPYGVLTPQKLLTEIEETLAGLAENAGEPFFKSKRAGAAWEISPFIYPPEWHRDSRLTASDERMRTKNIDLSKQVRREARRLRSKIRSLRTS
ncbi:hypothetical protein HY479_02205 [Candidatus Uhrbacteria bacterium]|nr:hypothetical protein [Candidatus Uhrbacteria bacterium]